MSEPATLLYRADSPDALAIAVVALMGLARSTTDDFSFGPLRLDELERDGLEVEGPDLARAMEALLVIPGLAQVDN